MKLTFERCSCGDPACRYWQPKNFGTFTQGTGFTQGEAMQLRWAFEALEELQTLRRIIRNDPSNGEPT